MRFVFWIFLLLNGSSLLYGQSTDNPLFSLILKGGPSLNQIDGDNYSGYTKPGYLIEVESEFPVKENLFLSVCLRNRMKGGKSSLFRNSFSDYEVFQFNYAGPKLGIRYIDKNRASLGFGLAYNRLINYRIRKNGEDNISEYAIPNNDEFSFLFTGSIKVNSKLWIFLEFERSILSIAKWQNSNLKNNGVIHKGSVIGVQFRAFDLK